MTLTYFGHSCFLLKTKKAAILFDPFISPNELVNETRSKNHNNVGTLLDPNDIDCDFVLLSHGHEDHVADAEGILKRTGAKLVSNFEIVTWFSAKGITNFHPMNIGGKWEFDFGIVKSVPAVHSSGLPDGSYGGNPGGFVLEIEDKTIYYAGDTALTIDMKLLGECYQLDLALLPIGDNFTMGVEDAILASDFIDCDKVVGMHYDTFGYIKLDHEAAKKKFEDAGKSLTLMQIGQTLELN